MGETVLLMPDGAPPCLIRAFSECPHLQCFLAGNVLLRRLDTFRSIEDLTRQDDMEGEARLIVPGESGTDVNYGGSFHNPVYLLCCSEPLVGKEMVKPSLGQWTATITAPTALLSALSLAATDYVPGRDLFEAMLLQVHYSKQIRIRATPTSEERYRLMLAQKPLRFVAEREWRYALVLSGGTGDSPKELSLKVPNMGRFADSGGAPLSRFRPTRKV